MFLRPTFLFWLFITEGNIRIVSRETLSMELLKSCLICNSIRSEKYLAARDSLVSKSTFTLKKCSDCGFIFTNPRPHKNAISDYYVSEEYISHSAKKGSLFNRLYNIIRDRNISYKLRLISEFKKEPSNIYDYGCGVGTFLNKASRNGWNVKGYEPNEKARTLAIQSGIEIETPDQILSNEKKCMDVITLWHVLEHIHDLNETITTLISLLSDDGVLVVAVPIADSWDAVKYKENWAALDVPRHLYHFTQSSIEKLFSKFGMKIASVHPLKFDAYYISLLSEKTPILKYFATLINGWYSNYRAKHTSRYSSLIFFIQKNME